MKVTISDVAKLAGVSTATVSHTINNTRYVSNETKEKVYRAIEELGYTPDASARSFRTGKKKIIGFIVPDIANKFFATMIESVEKYLSANGYQLIIANTRENMDREETNIRLLTAGLVDGLLVASTMDDFQRFDALIPAGFPVVLVDRIFETKKYSSVCVSNFQPIYRSVCRLAGKGDQRIGIIGGLPRLSSTQERISAYRQAVADCGLPEDEHLIQYGDSLENSACACLDQLLERKCDAIIVCQGLMASETIIYLHQKGIQLAGCFRHIAFSQELPGMIHFKHWIPPPSACRKGPEDALPHLLSSGFLPFEGKQCPPFCSLIMVIHFGMRWVIFSRPFRSIIVRP